MRCENCYWAGSIKDFMNTNDSVLLDALEAGSMELYPEKGEGNMSFQLGAWKDELRVLKKLAKEIPEIDSWGIIFEYRISREGGRRPDVLLISEGCIFVLEFKTTYSASRLQANIDQVSEYRNDLMNYHEMCWRNDPHMRVYAILVYKTGLDSKTTNLQKNTVAVDHAGLIGGIKTYIEEHPGQKGSQACLEEFLSYPYSPRPNIIESAKAIFRNEPLPQIRTAKALGLDKTVNSIIEIINNSFKRQRNALIVITGVPGAGKTYAGLQLAYTEYADDEKGVLLSGNGPLVKVLNYVLKNKVYVQPVHNFLLEYKNKIPKESVIIYDEAQRAWDEETARSRRKGSHSEPVELVNIAIRKKKGTILVALVGEGQEINYGEEGGLEEWNNAIKAFESEFDIYCPPSKKEIFSNAISEDFLSLTGSLRSISTEYPKWVELVLNGESDKARQTLEHLRLSKEYPVYITRDLEKGKEYIKERYEDDDSKTYGLMASSRADFSRYPGIDNSYESTRKLDMRIGEWYAGSDNSLPLCRKLDSWVTEFQCQGLEIDFALIAWGKDFYRKDGQWVENFRSKNKAKFKDPWRIEQNIYRVLMTRGRDGLVIHVPTAGSCCTDHLQETYEYLKSCGCEELV